MKVLFVTRPDVLTHPGGDTIQLLKTKSALENLGVQIELGQPRGEILEWADIVHVFNAQTPETSLPALLSAREAGKKTVLSPIWWDLSHANQVTFLSKFLNLHLPKPVWQLTLPTYNFVDRLRKKKHYSNIYETLRSADLLLPNSFEEMSCLKQDFGGNLPPHHIVMNAVDASIFRKGLSVDTPGQGIICCARAEPLKNQLSLIRAVAGIPNTSLTLVGRGNHNHNYNQRVRHEITMNNFDWIESHLPQDEMADLMRRHAVHALPSFRESPGLSTLEALASGLNVVVSTAEYCPIQTYFHPWLEKHVFTCVPYSVDSLRNALCKALSQKDHVLNFPEIFTWEYVARQTLEGYCAL